MQSLQNARSGRGIALGIGIAFSAALTAGMLSAGQSKQTSPRVAAKATTAEVVARLEALIPRLLSDGDVPGLSIALLRDGKVAWHQGFGLANAATKDPVTDDSVFEAASLSKPVFAYAVLKLVDAGTLTLDTPLVKYMPSPYDVGEDPRVQQITARHVLSHTTGFPNWRPQGQALKIHFTPGERFSYSGEGYGYLAKVIEHLTGEALEPLMRRLVFDPLGMTSSSYAWQDRYAMVKVFNHNRIGVTTVQRRPTTPHPAASLHTTAEDYCKFVAAILNGTGLKKETLRAMLSPQSRPNEVGPNTIDRPLKSPSRNLSWGLGWGLQRNADGTAFWHWGDNGDNRAFIVAYPKFKTGAVVFTDGANGLSIMPPILAEAVGGKYDAFAWLEVEPIDSPARVLLKSILAKGGNEALKEMRDQRIGLQIDETQMNRIGYDLMSMKKMQDAIEVFKLNVERFPQSWNVYDSLGEAYMRNGDREPAIRNYERSIELNPKNTGGIEALKKLRAQQPE
jgi:CubicO group peptidase (beta-lactamase class C family)